MMDLFVIVLAEAIMMRVRWKGLNQQTQSFLLYSSA